MAIRAAIGTGNFLTAGTWGLVDATLYANSETSALVCPTAYSNVARSAQQTPGAITVSHIGVKLAVRTGTTGTITVHIANSSHVEVAGTAVTINTADLPVAATADLNGGWVFFKLGTPVTLSAATLYEVEAQTSSASQVSLFGSAATNGMSCALITTTTGAPAAGDDLIVAGEYTGAGTSNSFTVTMNETATTDYGAASTSLVTPALAICSKGTLTWGTAAATAYNLKLSGNLVIYSGGTMNMGTTGTPCPRGSSMALNFDCGANVDFGLSVRNLGTWNAQGLSRTSGKNIVSCKLNTDEAVSSTSLGVDTDTGWLDNDVIAVASTTRTINNCEKGTLNGNAGASSLTVDGFAGAGGGLGVAHSGTSPTQAEVILLTRNVSVFGASSSLQAYIDISATATVDCDWAEFYSLGSSTALKRGIDVATTTGSCSFQFCAFHDFGVLNSIGFNYTGTTGNGFTYANNVTFNISTFALITVFASSATWTIDTNIFMLSTSTTELIRMGDVGGTFTNNTLVGCAGSSTGALGLQESGGTLGTFSNIISHSNAGRGVSITGGISGTMSAVTCWRNGGFGFHVGSYLEMTVEDLTAFGNLTDNINFQSATMAGKITFIDPVLSGDSTFSTTNGITTSATSGAGEVVLLNLDSGTASGIKTAHTNDINLGSNSYLRFFLHNCKLASATELTGQANMTPSSFIGSQKHDQTAGLHKTWKKYGTITIETTTKHTGSTSFKMTPNNASNKLESGSFKIAVASGTALTPSVYVNEDGSYNGARARLILKKNIAIGIAADTVIDTATAASDGAWEELTGTTGTATDDGVMEFVIDCDGTAGNLFVDSFTCS